jgi:hypothetical protein
LSAKSLVRRGNPFERVLATDDSQTARKGFLPRAKAFTRPAGCRRCASGEAALELAEEHYEADNAVISAARNALAVAHVELRDFPQATCLLPTLLAVDDSRELGYKLFESARGGACQDVREWRQDVLDKVEKQLGPKHPMMAIALDSLGIAQADLGDDVAALGSFKRAKRSIQPATALITRAGRKSHFPSSASPRGDRRRRRGG